MSKQSSLLSIRDLSKIELPRLTDLPIAIERFPDMRKAYEARSEEDPFGLRTVTATPSEFWGARVGDGCMIANLLDRVQISNFGGDRSLGESSPNRILLEGPAADVLNRYNSLYYNAPDLHTVKPTSRLLICNHALNLGIACEVRRHLESVRQPLRLLEIGAGSRANRWPAFLHGIHNHRIRGITLSDFDEAIVSKQRRYLREDARWKTSALSFTDTLPTLKPDDRYNVALASYVFDSIWNKGDRSFFKYTSKGGKELWYEFEFRLSYERSQPNPTLDFPESLPSVRDSRKIMIEYYLVPIRDIESQFCGELIKNRMATCPTGMINFPGGLIAKVHESFSSLLNPQGLFIIGDTALTADPVPAALQPISFDGFGAAVKVEDYLLAQQVLQLMGYHVELASALEYLRAHKPDGPLVRSWSEKGETYARAYFDSVQVLGAQNTDPSGAKILVVSKCPKSYAKPPHAVPGLSRWADHLKKIFT